jgi:lipopolysaccharide export system ATP-binding protein
MENENETFDSAHMTLHTEGLVKRYGKRTVASDVSIDVKQGEIVGLLGPNGAGKTTTFYMTTGLVVPNAGKVFLNDLDITDYPVYKRARAGIGYLPQEASVFRKLSVEDNIMAILQMTKLSKKEQLEKLERLIKEFRLEKVRKNKGDQLSGGERRRTEIARCLAIDPKFIMLDEPFAGVDPIAVEDIQHIVWQLKYRNIGILITDHNVQETLTITDRAYLLFEGKILFQGKPEELAANKIVREKYLSNSFVLRKKDFQYIDEQKRAREEEEAKAEQDESDDDSKKTETVAESPAAEVENTAVETSEKPVTAAEEPAAETETPKEEE